MSDRAMGSVFAVAFCLAVVLPANGEIITLQNGVSPTAEYAGCVDTWISNEPYEGNRDQGAAAVLQAGGQRAVLMRFNLSSLPKGGQARLLSASGQVHKAVLRLTDAGYPRPGKDGAYPSVLKAYALARTWDANANWLEHRRMDYKAKDAGDWAAPGGDIDAASDFGRGEKGLVAADTVTAGPWGHVHELDVTEAVRRWQADPAANFGLLLRGSQRCQLASADWPVARARPVLIVDCGAAAEGIAPLAGAPKEVELDGVAATADNGKPAGDYATIRIGQHPACALRGASASAYVKENTAQFPGTWGWMTQCRIGGVAGDVSRTLLYFDLTGLPKDASIQKAQLVCSLVPQMTQQISAYRYGAYRAELPESPGWSAEEATAGERQAGRPWPKGSAAACTSAKPVAIGQAVEKRIEVRGEKRTIPAEIRFDLTGTVRAWLSGKVPNCGVMLDNRIEGGAYDIFSARAFRAELRPYLEIAISPASKLEVQPLEVKPAAPPADWWVQPMREVHKRFKGTPGTLAQYGDSITVTMAFLAPYGWSKKIDARNMTPEVRAEADRLEKYADLSLWRKWKEGEYGNTGMMKSDWLFHNIDSWQRKMNPEAAVIMFGTNDIGSLWPPEYTENMAASLRRMMADGTVPMLTSIPPAAREGHYEYWLAALSIAHGLKVPLIDYYAEVLRRRPEDWNGRLDKFVEFRKNVYDAPTLVSADGTHPSNPKQWQNDFSEEALNHNGFVLRNYMTIRQYAEVIRKVFQAEGRR